MFSALFYLHIQSVKNRFLQRIKRLRSPRYFLGAMAGGFYLALMFGRSALMFGGHHVQLSSGLLPGIGTAEWEFIIGLTLCIGMVLAWMVPNERAALVFSEAEIAFLFPAPVRRVTLIHYKLVRSQTAILFTVIFLTVLSRWSGGAGGALRRALGWWLLLSTINLHLLGSSFVRTILIEHGIIPWQRRAVAVTVAATALFATAWWVSSEIRAPTAKDMLSVNSVVVYVGQLARTRPAVYLLAPFRWLVRPFLVSNDAVSFLHALGPAVLVLALHYWWVVRADVAFEEASLAASKRHAVRSVAIREGRWQHARPASRRRAPFRLSPTGPPAMAILWKNLLSAGRMFSARIGLVLLVSALTMGSSLSSSADRTVWPQMFGTVTGILALWSVVLGPQFVRQDFRQDLAASDLLKMYPVKGWQLALGELLTPALILTVIQWGLIILTATFLDRGFGESGADENANHRQQPIALAISAAVIVGPLNIVSLLIPNAAALLLPAWFAGPASGGATRGIEVMGQRLIFLLAQFIALSVAVIPAALMAFITYTLVARPYLPVEIALPVVALIAASIFAAEAAGGLALLGHWFEGYDLSVETPP